MESDPIGLSGGANTYGYVYGDPLRHFDRTGEAGALAAAAGGACIAVTICAFVPACNQSLQSGARSLLQAITAMANSNSNGNDNSSSSSSSSPSGAGGQVCSNCPPPDPCDKKLSPYEIDALQRNGIDVHDMKTGFGGPPKHFDLYKCKNGEVVVKRKGSSDILERLNLNINDLLHK